MKSQILLYGASNLWLSRRAALTEVRRRFNGMLEVGLAHGPGRSYGLRAGNPLFRYEPLGEVDFGLAPGSATRKVAFITDIGNDIAYSQRPADVVNWVKSLVLRLEKENYEIVVGGIPASSLSRLHPRLFNTLAKLYYPDGVVDKEQVTRDLEEVEIGVRELCHDREHHFIPVNAEWYAVDRFHLRPSTRMPYWQTLLNSFSVKYNYDSKWSLRVRRPVLPQKYWLVGKERQGQSRYSDLVPNSVVLVR